jgi:hypothetical protein
MPSALRILIVDDSDVTRRILGTIVRFRHWTNWTVCGEAGNGWIGVKNFPELKPDSYWIWQCQTWMASKPHG